MIKKTSKTNKAFTLIETLVAITILMIAIAGPLTVANKGYTSSIDARNQSIAINLAQEGIEYFSYLKDNKIWGDWTQGTAFTEKVDQYYSGCLVELPCEKPFQEADAAAINVIPTGFTRSYHFAVQSNDQVLVVMNVTWRTALLTGNIELRQIFTSYDR